MSVFKPGDVVKVVRSNSGNPVGHVGRVLTWASPEKDYNTFLPVESFNSREGQGASQVLEGVRWWYESVNTVQLVKSADPADMNRVYLVVRDGPEPTPIEVFKLEYEAYAACEALNLAYQPNPGPYSVEVTSA